MSSVFYPRCAARLSVVFDGMGGPNSRPLLVDAVPRSATVNRNGYHEADTWTLEFDARTLPFDPNLIASCAVTIYMWDAGTAEAIGDYAQWATPDHEMVRGLADEPTLTFGDSTTLSLSGRDYTAVLDPEWDPRKKVPAGLPLDETVRRIAELAAPPGTSARFEVIWRSAKKPPTVGAAQRSTKKKGLWVKPGTTHWDLIYSTALTLGYIAYVEGAAIILADPNTQTSASAARGARLAYGRDLLGLTVRRNLARERVPQIKMNTTDPKTGKLISVLYPAKGKKDKNALGVVTDEILDLPAPDGVVDRDTMLRCARLRFRSMSRAEAVYQFRTRHLTAETAHGPAANLLQLRAGDPISIAFDAFNQEAMRQLDSGARIEHLLNLGYSNSLATFVAANYERLAQFEQPYYTRQVSFDWSQDDGLQIEVEAVNYVSEAREQAREDAENGHV